MPRVVTTAVPTVVGPDELEIVVDPFNDVLEFNEATNTVLLDDMSDPVSALRAMKRLAKAGGAVIVMDEKVGETFTPAGNEIEPLMYGFSVFHCLPVGMADHPSVGTGTVMRPDTLRGYAREAGFQEMEILPIDTFFFRFYRLR